MLDPPQLDCHNRTVAEKTANEHTLTQGNQVRTTIIFSILTVLNNTTHLNQSFTCIAIDSISVATTKSFNLTAPRTCRCYYNTVGVVGVTIVVTVATAPSNAANATDNY